MLPIHRIVAGQRIPAAIVTFRIDPVLITGHTFTCLFSGKSDARASADYLS